MIRSFYRAGHRVIIADAKSSALCRWSKFKHQFYHIPPPVQAFSDFKEAVRNIVEKEKITDCIPVYEESFYISKIRDELNCKVWMPGIDLTRKLHRKDKFIEIAKDFFDVPFTLNYADFDDFSNLDQFIFKPIYSRFANNIFIQPLKKELIDGVKNKSHWIAQEFIKGKEICAYSIWDNGEMKACCFYQPKIRFGKGASIHFEPSQYNDLKMSIKKFGEAHQYQGQLSFDFIEKNGKYYVIECNPRATSGAHLFSSYLSKIYFESQISDYDNLSTKGLKFLMLMNKPSLLFSKKFRATKDVLFDSKDLLPMIMQVVSMVEIIALAWRKGLTILEATTYDIEWNGDEIDFK